MQIWSYWLEVLQSTLQLLSAAGFSAGAAVIVLTFLLRLVLLPVSWSSAYRGGIHQKKLRKLQPDLQRLRERFRDRPEELAQRTLDLYRQRNVAFVDGRTLLGALAQMPMFLGMFHLLRNSAEAVRFLWVSSLAKPDLFMAILAGITTAMMMVANPDLPEQTRMIMIVLPSVIAFVFALKFSSALAIYWITSNLFTAAQTALAHVLINQRIRNGTVTI